QAHNKIMEFPKIKISSKLVRCIFIGSAGMFAGMGSTLSLAAVPAMLASTDPIPTWKVIYQRGKTIAIITVLTSSVAALHLLYKKGDLRYLACAALNLSVIPYTLKFMKPTNNALLALKRAKPDEIGKEEKNLIVTWGGLQWVRTVLGISTLAIGLHAVFYK
ncbi:unnamed protein product, partial [Allacma fusca]